MLHAFLLLTALSDVAAWEPVAATSQSPGRTWPSGVHGDLLVRQNDVVSLQPGHVYDFRSITVESGGTIEILPGDSWTILGCAGDMVLRGRIVGKNATSIGSAQNVMIAPDEERLSHTAQRTDGGAGGDSWRCGVDTGNPAYRGNGGPPSGPPSPGNGGGGAATVRHGPPGTATAGGGGATAQSAGSDIGAGGAGGTGWGGNGSPGAPAEGPSMGQNFGGGGGGGSRGRHGQPIYIRVLGSYLGVGGTIDVSGSDGGNGGAGGNTNRVDPRIANYPGAGGGGGGGGSGGTIFIRYRNEYLPSRFVFQGGKEGAGGAGGTADRNPNRRACAGRPGNPGADGYLRTRRDGES